MIRKTPGLVQGSWGTRLGSSRKGGKKRPANQLYLGCQYGASSLTAYEVHFQTQYSGDAGLSPMRRVGM